MKEMNEIRDDEIRVIGEEKPSKPQGWKWLLLLLAVIVIGIVIWKLWPSEPEPPVVESEQGVFEPSNEVVEQPAVKLPLAKAEETGHAFIEMADTIINDIPIRLYIPHQVIMSLYIGAIDRNDLGRVRPDYPDVTPGYGGTSGKRDHEARG